MIGQLVLTDIKSSLADLLFLVAVAVPVFLLLGFLSASNEESEGSFVLLFLLLVSFLVSSLITGMRMFVRQYRERRIRLFSQLPVSIVQVGIASWCFRLLCASIPTVLWASLMWLLKGASVSSLGEVSAAASTFFFTLVALIALISSAINLTNLPASISRLWTTGYVALAIAVAFVFIWMQPNVVEDLFSVAVGRSSASALIPMLAISSGGLVFVDIWLRSRVDNNLG